MTSNFPLTISDFRKAALLALTVMVGTACLPSDEAVAQIFGFDNEPAARTRRQARQQVRRNREPRQAARKETVASKEKPAKPEARTPKVAVIPTPPEPLVAVISLQSQRIQVHNSQGILAESKVSTGQAGHRTPTGIFSVLQRNRYHESNIYSGAPMPFMQRVTWSGIALHLGVVPGYPASHGCIRLPGEFASRLWGLGRVGMRVIIAPGEAKPQAIAHARLPVPAMTAVAANVAPDSVQTASVATASIAAGSVAAGSGAAGSIATGSIEGSSSAGDQRILDPFKYAQARKIKAAADSIATEKAIKPAYELARDKSAEASRQSDEMRRLERKVADSERKVADAERNVAAKASVVGPTDVSTVAATDSLAQEQPAALQLKTAVQDLATAKAELAAARTLERTKSDEAFDAAKAARTAEAAAAAAVEAAKLANVSMEPVSIFVSRKEGRVFVRQGFVPIHDEPITFTIPEQPLGTHIYTAMTAKDGGAALGWEVVTVPNTPPEVKGKDEKPRKKKGEPEAAPKPHVPASTAVTALDRFELPEATRKLVSERMWPGASLIVSDNGISGETGKGTDFVVLTK